jgi:hypothetical protein
MKKNPKANLNGKMQKIKFWKRREKRNPFSKDYGLNSKTIKSQRKFLKNLKMINQVMKDPVTVVVNKVKKKKNKQISLTSWKSLLNLCVIKRMTTWTRLELQMIALKTTKVKLLQLNKLDHRKLHKLRMCNKNFLLIICLKTEIIN